MDNLKFSLFDVFAYAVPGSVALLAGIIFFEPNLLQLSDLSTLFQNIAITTGLVAIVAAYILGFALDTLGSWIYYQIGCRIWGQPYDRKNKRLSNATERALIIQFSPEINSYIHNWKIIKTMSHNLSAAALLLSVATCVKSFQGQSQYTSEWLAVSAFSLLCSILFLHRTSIFDKWYYRDLSESVKTLHLERRAIKELETSTNGEGNSEPRLVPIDNQRPTSTTNK